MTLIERLESAEALPSQKVLNKLLRYIPETGEMFWRPRTPDLLAETAKGPKKYCAYWNGRYAGKPALGAKDAYGYEIGSIFAIKQKKHRVIWKMVTGEEPDTIDHINGNPSDNRWENLRGASRVENQKNTAMRNDNISGVVGVSWDRKNERWRASITSNGRTMNLGRYSNFRDAVDARMAAEIKYKFHKNHGRQKHVQ